jgi:hypothetical protein
MADKGEGAAIRFIRDHERYQHKDWCLIWPFSTTRGYGRFGYLGKGYYAHRFMCELAHGRAPSPTHEAAHSCGDTACVNPNHLSWKTPGENGLDNRQHGTHVRSRYGNVGKLTSEQADAIRAQKDEKTLLELADEYGVSESCISNVWTGKTHYRPRKIIHWTADQDAKLKAAIEGGAKHKEVAEIVGKPTAAVAARAARLGIKSKWRTGPLASEERS